MISGRSPFTLLGTGALAAAPANESLLAATVLAWMVVPAAGLYYTGREVAAAPRVYSAGAALSVLGAAAYVAGLALVGVGQTAGIVAAVVQY
ncbi:hypothetical protein BRC83_06730 [Halobacteriales archaeon QS_1_68_17]|nr:MAG: hypothetical protein BRC83_06730 [Halobacteriales archaeon QS_1_68_17]